MKIYYSLLCDYALIDKADKLSLIGIFDKANFTGIPNVLVKFCIYAAINIEDINSVFTINIDIKDPNGLSILQKQPQVQLKVGKDQNKGRLIIEFNNVKFTKSGKYSFEIIVDNKVINKNYLNVEVS